MLRDNPHLLKSKEGRELLRAAGPHVDFEKWRGALSNDPPSKDFYRADEILKELFEQIRKKRETWPPKQEPRQDDPWGEI